MRLGYPLGAAQAKGSWNIGSRFFDAWVFKTMGNG